MPTVGMSSSSALTIVQLRPPNVPTAKVYGSRSAAPSRVGSAVSRTLPAASMPYSGPRNSTSTDHMLHTENPMCSENTEKIRLRLAIRAPFSVQKSGSSGRQSSIQYLPWWVLGIAASVGVLASSAWTGVISGVLIRRWSCSRRRGRISRQESGAVEEDLVVLDLDPPGRQVGLAAAGAAGGQLPGVQVQRAQHHGSVDLTVCQWATFVRAHGRDGMHGSASQVEDGNLPAVHTERAALAHRHLGQRAQAVHRDVSRVPAGHHGGHRVGTGPDEPTLGSTSSGSEVRNWPGVAGFAPSCHG